MNGGHCKHFYIVTDNIQMYNYVYFFLLFYQGPKEIGDFYLN